MEVSDKPSVSFYIPGMGCSMIVVAIILCYTAYKIAELFAPGGTP